MGMALFESSGTFKPGDYGLSTGDTIQIVAVGGGGGGSGATVSANSNGCTAVVNTGGTGGTSSFGSIVSALGGQCLNSGTQGGALATGGSGAVQYCSKDADYYGGAGAGGWYPGVANCMVSAVHALPDNMPIYAFDSTAGVARTGGRTSRGGGGYLQNGCYNGIGAKCGSGAGGGGGAGYGAGGGGGSYRVYSDRYGGAMAGGAGGNAGQLKVVSYTLKNTDTSFAITVGAGGAAGGGGYAGGAGAPGCVAVFW